MLFNESCIWVFLHRYLLRTGLIGLIYLFLVLALIILCLEGIYLKYIQTVLISPLQPFNLKMTFYTG